MKNAQIRLVCGHIYESMDLLNSNTEGPATVGGRILWQVVWGCIGKRAEHEPDSETASEPPSTVSASRSYLISCPD